jgi:dimethylargininase
MRSTAITREVSPGINRCELSFHNREPIDVEKAIAQHNAYVECLARLGIDVLSLPAEPDLPDSVFVEDAAVIVNELAVITRMGAPSRRPEAATLAEVVSRYRSIEFLSEPATLDGGDVLRIGSRLFVGETRRTNREGINQLREILGPHGYTVEAVEVKNCLHLKSGCSYLGNNRLLINRSCVDEKCFPEFELIEVPKEEPAAANALLVNDVVIIPTVFHRTHALLQNHALKVVPLLVSELQKAEAGVTCCSLIFDSDSARTVR